MIDNYSRYPDPQPPASEPIPLYAYDKDFNLLGVISNYISLLWAEERAGLGEFQLVCTDDDYNLEILQKAVFYKRPDRKTAMQATYFRGETESNNVYVRGRASIIRVGQRVTYPTSRIYKAERDTYKMIADNLRGLEYTTTAPEQGFSEVYDTQYTGKELTEAVFDICQTTGFGIVSVFDTPTKQHIITIYKGADRTDGNPDGNPRQVFSTDFGTLTDTLIVKDDSIFKNVAYVAGGGEGEDRTWVIVGDATGDDRYEMYADARDLQQDENETLEDYKSRLTARGIQRLNERLKVLTFEGIVTPEGFGTEYDLGDRITCKSEQYNLLLDTTIERFDEVREGNNTTLKLTLGEPQITQRRLVKVWQS